MEYKNFFPKVFFLFLYQSNNMKTFEIVSHKSKKKMANKNCLYYFDTQKLVPIFVWSSPNWNVLLFRVKTFPKYLSVLIRYHLVGNVILFRDKKADRSYKRGKTLILIQMRISEWTKNPQFNLNRSMFFLSGLYKSWNNLLFMSFCQ